MNVCDWIHGSCARHTVRVDTGDDAILTAACNDCYRLHVHSCKAADRSDANPDLHERMVVTMTATK